MAFFLEAGELWIFVLRPPDAAIYREQRRCWPYSDGIVVIPKTSA